MPILLLGLEKEKLNDATRAEIAHLAPDYQLLVTPSEEEALAAIGEIEIAAGRVPMEIVLRGPRLRWYQQWGAGADWLLRHPEMRQREVIVTNASGVHAVPISEHILALLLALARQIPDAVRAQDQRQWRRQEMGEVLELAGKTMVLVGVGAIGGRLARLAAALEMRVIGVRRDPSRPAEGVARMVGPEALDEVLPQADFVVLTAPLTHETQHLIHEARLRRMKPSSILINIGRGRTIDQKALIRALQEGWIGGAGLDVTDPEPLPADSPLWGLPNVLITAHYAGRTPAYDARALAIFMDNLARYVTGQPLRNVVDPERGY